MRLRKNMKRTAAAVLALSMAVSAVAAPASAAYICDVSKGNVEISVDESGNKSIKVGELSFEGLELVTPKEVVVCSVKATRNSAAAAAAATEEGEE